MPAEALRNSRRRVVGAKETLKQVIAGNALEVYIARDTKAKVVAAIIAESERRHLPVYYVETMQALGEMCGIEVSAASAALTQSVPAQGHQDVRQKEARDADH